MGSERERMNARGRYRMSGDRMVVEVPFGFALYRRSVSEGDDVWRHTGLVPGRKDAEAFLTGKKDFGVVRVYGHKEASE